MALDLPGKTSSEQQGASRNAEEATNATRQDALRLSAEGRSSVANALVESLESPKRVQVLANQFLGLSSQDRAEVAQAIGLRDPSQVVSDKIWLLVVRSLSVVLVGAFAVLSVGMFWRVDGIVKAELVFAVFTSVVGFLGGLVVPNSARGGASRGSQ